MSFFEQFYPSINFHQNALQSENCLRIHIKFICIAIKRLKSEFKKLKVKF